MTPKKTSLLKALLLPAFMLTVIAWGQIETEEGCDIESLVATLKDNNRFVRWDAAKALDECGWNAKNDQEKVLYYVAAKQWDKCVEIGSAAVEILIVRLKDSDKWVRVSAAKTLGQIGDGRSVEPLLAALKDDDKDVRYTASQALIKMGSRAVKPLLDALDDDNHQVRKDAAETLGSIGDKRAIKALAAALQDRNHNVRWEAAQALDKLGWKANSVQEKTHYYIAAKQWGKCNEIGSPAVDPLAALLKDSDINIRREAIKALGTIGDSRAVTPLLIVFKDNYSSTKKAAAKALGQIGDSRAIDPLLAILTDNGQDQDVREEAAEALGKIGNKAVEPLITELKNDDQLSQSLIAKALGITGDKRAAEPLVEVLKKNDNTKTISEALVQIGDDAIEPMIAELSAMDMETGFNEKWRSAMEKTLANLGEHARDKLLEVAASQVVMLNDEDESNQIKAARILDNLGYPVKKPLIHSLDREFGWFIIKVGQICDGEGFIEEAAPYTKDKGPHSIILVYDDALSESRYPKEWSSFLQHGNLNVHKAMVHVPSTWIPESLHDLTLIAVLRTTIESPDTSVYKVTPYTVHPDGKKVKGKPYTKKESSGSMGTAIRIFEAQSGKVIAEKTFEYIGTNQGEYVKYSNVFNGDVLPWLKSFVVRW